MRVSGATWVTSQQPRLRVCQELTGILCLFGWASPLGPLLTYWDLLPGPGGSTLPALPRLALQALLEVVSWF